LSTNSIDWDVSTVDLIRNIFGSFKISFLNFHNYQIEIQLDVQELDLTIIFTKNVFKKYAENGGFIFG